MPKRKIEVQPDNLILVTTRLPAEVVDYLETRARRTMRTRSDVVRTCILADLRHQGVVADVEDELEPV